MKDLLAVDIIPMRLPETISPEKIALASEGQLTSNGLSLRNGQSEIVSTQIPSNTHSVLLVYPGEPSELLVQLHNKGDQPFQVDLTLELQKDFPQQWCQFNTERKLLAPKIKTEFVLRFIVPINFFEHRYEQREIDFSHRLRLQHDLVEKCMHFVISVRPRSLYLNYLPALYREIDFMGRLLAIFEQAFEPISQSMDVLWGYLDPLTAPESMLPFLAYWVGWPMEERWPLLKQRQLIRNAISLYRWRGTRRGLRLYLHLYTGLPLDEHLEDERRRHIYITEPTGEGFIVNTGVLGMGTMLGGGEGFHFSVRLQPSSPQQQIDETLVRYIINQHKPAASTYDLQILQFEMQQTSPHP